ncbi:hypothetical protein MCUN1_000924 [Malassezia cuniculi]|uniref:Uncharacterized protein n=1 Tax=Malassezia cuniculi TaxID=948313 RepID=A0AAF0J534_9BASI|nr:hypothetical protein MCUN1_000924 [Malassezia cuniculi]
MTTLEVPVINAPPSDAHEYPLPLGNANVPTLLRYLLASLQLAVQCSFSGQIESSARPVFSHIWRGDKSASDAASDAPESSETPVKVQQALADDSFREGIFFDGHVWRVQWVCAVSVPYPRSKPGAEAISVSANAHLRLDFTKLAQHVSADPPQFPAYYSATTTHPYFSANDPLVVDVDVLSTLTDGICIPDETELERHKRVANNMCLLPLASLAQGSLGTDIVSPWNGAQDLSVRIRRAQELEAAASAPDADIVMASGSDRIAKTTDETGHQVGLASALVMGSVVLVQKALVRVTAYPTLSVRIRTLHLPALAPIGAPSEIDSPMRSMLLSVELENAAAHGAFVVHDLNISITAPQKTPDCNIHAAGEILPVVHSASTPGHEAHVLPAKLCPHDQTNVLYTVRLDGIHDGDIDRMADLDVWPAQRSVRVVMYGGPERQGQSIPSCASSWNGLLDLSALRHEWKWRLFSYAVTLDAAGAPRSAPTTRASLVAGSTTLVSSQLAASRRSSRTSMSESIKSPVIDSHATFSKEAPSLPRRAAAASAFPWETGNQKAPINAAEPEQTLLVTVELGTEEGKFTSKSAVLRESWRVCMHVSVFNVSPDPMQVTVSWENASPNTLVSTSSTFAIGTVAPGTAQDAQIWVEALEHGMHDLGSLVIYDEAGSTCRLHRVGAVAAC